MKLRWQKTDVSLVGSESPSAPSNTLTIRTPCFLTYFTATPSTGFSLGSLTGAAPSPQPPVLKRPSIGP